MIASFRAFITSTLILLLTACGGGGSIERDNTGGGNSGGGTGGGSATLTIELSIANAAGENTNLLSADTPLTITATVTDSSGNAVQNEDVSFSFNESGFATFSNAVSIANTDNNGQASVVIIVGDNAGGAFVNAQIGDGTTAQIGFNSAGTDQNVQEPASLELFASAIQLASSGGDQIELIALVKNDSNVLLEGVDISFSVDSGELEVTQGTSAADGTARALVSTRTNPTNRSITAVASTGNLRQELIIDVVGTEVNLSGASSVVLNDSVPVTILVADSDGTGIPNQVVSVSATQGQISNPNPTTDSQGQVTINYTASASGADTITANALNVEGTLNLTVQQDSFEFVTVPSSEVALGDNAILTVRWLRDGSPFVGGDVSFSSSRGSILTPTATTDANGLASFTISSDNAGLASVSAEGTDGADVTVTTRSQIEFIATVPDTIIVDATPDSIGPEGQTATVTAVVRDPTGNLVKGVSVNFRVNDISGGSVFPDTAVTDSNGIASTVYTSNAVSNEDAVIIYADVSSDTSVTDFTTLTVANRAFDMSIGTGNTIQVPDESSYIKEFSVFVSDAEGGAVANVNLTPSATPVKFANGGTYSKGFWQWNPIDEIWEPIVTAVCPNEDINANGILDEGEDTNGDGELTPGIIGTIAFDGSDSTDDNGQARLLYRYPKNVAPWTTIEVAVFGISAGSEASVAQAFGLTVAAEDITVESVSPPPNPFGRGSLCTNTD